MTFQTPYRVVACKEWVGDLDTFRIEVHAKAGHPRIAVIGSSTWLLPDTFHREVIPWLKNCVGLCWELEFAAVNQKSSDPEARLDDAATTCSSDSHDFPEQGERICRACGAFYPASAPGVDKRLSGYQRRIEDVMGDL